jgi:hypothetical protein
MDNKLKKSTLGHLFDENKLQNLAVIRGGTTFEADYATLSAAEIATVIFEEEGASVTKPFGKTTYCNPPGVQKQDYAVFWIKFTLYDDFVA